MFASLCRVSRGPDPVENDERGAFLQRLNRIDRQGRIGCRTRRPIISEAGRFDIGGNPGEGQDLCRLRHGSFALT